MAADWLFGQCSCEQARSVDGGVPETAQFAGCLLPVVSLCLPSQCSVLHCMKEWQNKCCCCCCGGCCLLPCAPDRPHAGCRQGGWLRHIPRLDACAQLVLMLAAWSAAGLAAGAGRSASLPLASYAFLRPGKRSHSRGTDLRGNATSDRAGLQACPWHRTPSCGQAKSTQQHRTNQSAHQRMMHSAK